MGNSRYLVFREYTRGERPGLDERTVFYGWTDNKNVIKAFFKQRDPDKYSVRKAKYDEDNDYGYYNINGIPVWVYDDDEENVRINYVSLKSSATGEEFNIFMTPREMHETEIKIQRMLYDKSDLSDITGSGNYVGMIINLQEEYCDALDIIGYRPQDIEALLPSYGYRDGCSDINEIEDNIDIGYGEMNQLPHDQITHKPAGSSYIDPLYAKMIYSIESFIMALRDDM